MEQQQQQQPGRRLYGIVMLLITVVALGAAGWGAWSASKLVKQLTAPTPASARPLKHSRRAAPVVVTPDDVTRRSDDAPAMDPDGVMLIDPPKASDSPAGPQGRATTPDPKSQDTLISEVDAATTTMVDPAGSFTNQFASRFTARVYPRGLQCRQPRLYASSDAPTGPSAHGDDPMVGPGHFYQYDDQGNAGIQRVNQGFSWGQH